MRGKTRIPTILAGLSIVALAGCTQYAWVHDSKSFTEVDKDMLDCEDKAASVYPTAVATNVSGGRSDGTTTACGAGDKSAGCVTTTGRSTGVSSYSRDLNESNRRNYINRCMRAGGWRQVEIKD